VHLSQGSEGFSEATADKVCEVLAASQTPCLVVCASGARASAAVSIFLARRDHADPQSVISEAIAASLPWAGMMSLRHWVATGIQAEEARRLKAIDPTLRRVSEDSFAAGIMDKETLSAAVKEVGAKSVIQLVPYPDPLGTDLSSATGGATTTFLPIGPPDGEYTAASAGLGISAVQSAAKPVLVLCRTGTRAEAMADIARAEAEGLGAEQLLGRCATRAWITRSDIVSWVREVLP
jgi:protein tyrosine phosphatase (PTP) superfamily phosphohydrolase (DUF442 family)